MRSILVFGLLAALTVVAVESLECAQCYSFSPDCNADPTPCPEDASGSCCTASASWPVDGELKSYHEKFCSGLPAGTSLGFAIRVTGQKPAWFTTRCSQETCSAMSLAEDFPESGTGNTQCPACLGSNVTSCVGTPQTCNAGEQCIDLYAEIVVGGAVQYRLALKGCSSIKEAACNYLSAGNIAVGNVVFRHLQCSPALPSSTTCSSGLGPATLRS